MLTEWRQVQNSTYRKQEIISDLGLWQADLLSRQWQLQKVVVNPVGGMIVAILKKLDESPAAAAAAAGPAAAAAADQTNITYLKVYTPFGSIVCETKLSYSCTNVLKGLWINYREFVLIFQDGVIRLYDTCCCSKPYAYTVTKKPLRICAICVKGAVLITSDNQIIWYDFVTKDPVMWKHQPGSGGAGGLSAAGLSAASLSAAGLSAAAALTSSIKPSSSSSTTSSLSSIKFVEVYDNGDDEVYALMISQEGSVYQIWSNGCRLVKFTSAGAETTSSIFVSFSFSHSRTFAAFATDDGFLMIANLHALKLSPGEVKNDQTTQPKTSSSNQANTGGGGGGVSNVTTTLVLTATIVSTPTLMPEQMVWLGDHCVGITSRAPTSNNPSQSCLFIGGPHSKWIDMLFSSPVILVGGRDLKYLCYNSLGVIQFAEPETLKTFSPGSCHAASMICFALDDQIVKQNPEKQFAQSSDWDEDTHDEIKRLEDSMRKQLSENRLTKTEDLNYLYFRKKWNAKRRRRKENDALGFVKSLTYSERMETLNTLMTALKYEYNMKNIILALRSIHQILSVLKADVHNRLTTRASAGGSGGGGGGGGGGGVRSSGDSKQKAETTLPLIDFSQYYRLIRDFRIIRRITISIEVVINYEDFLDLRLTNLIDLCQRDYQLCCGLCSAYNLKSFYNPNNASSTQANTLLSASDGGSDDRGAALDQIERYVNLQKSKLMLYTLINALANTSTHENILKNSKGENDLLNKCIKDLLKPGKFDEYSIEGIRSAAWACLKYNKKELGCQILRAHEKTKHVLLYYFRLIDDVKAIIRYAMDNDDTDSLDYALYLQCQNIYNMFDNKSVPARFHMNQISSIVSEICAESDKTTEVESQPPSKGAKLASSGKLSNASDTTNTKSQDNGPKSFYRSDPYLVEAYCLRKFMQNDAATTDLPNTYTPVLFQKLGNEIQKIFEDTPNVTQNTSQPVSTSGSSSFLSNLINPRSFIKDNKKQHIQKAIPEMRKLAQHFDQAKRGGVFSDCKQGYLEYIDFIEYQNINKTSAPLKATPKELITSLIEKNQELQLKEAVAKFEIPGSIVRLWKLECLAKNDMWPVFCECAIKAIQSVSVEKRLKKLGSSTSSSNSASFNIFSLNIPFNPRNRGSQDDDVVTRLLRNSQSSDGATSGGGITGIIGSVLSSKADQAGPLFMPLLPSAMTTPVNGNNVDNHCPESLPASTYSTIAVVDFVSIAAANDKANLALCLVPYINSASLRDKWCQSLGIRGPSDEFCRNALLCAGARSGRPGLEGDYQEFIKTVKKALENKAAQDQQTQEGAPLTKNVDLGALG